MQKTRILKPLMGATSYLQCKKCRSLYPFIPMSPVKAGSRCPRCKQGILRPISYGTEENIKGIGIKLE